MSSLYDLTPALEKKYEKTSDFSKDIFFVRYNKRYFELLSSGNHEEYAPLFSALEEGVEYWVSEALRYNAETTLTLEHYRKGHSMTVSRNIYHMYLNFLENVILPELTEPEEGAKLLITTHNGGTYLAYYRNKQYEVPMANRTIKVEDGIIIHWLPYEEKYNPFTG